MKRKLHKKLSGFNFGLSDNSIKNITLLINQTTKGAKVQIIFLNDEVLHIFINQIFEIKKDIMYSFKGVTISKKRTVIKGRLNLFRKRGKIYGLPNKLAFFLQLRRPPNKLRKNIRHI